MFGREDLETIVVNCNGGIGNGLFIFNFDEKGHALLVDNKTLYTGIYPSSMNFPDITPVIKPIEHIDIAFKIKGE